MKRLLSAIFLLAAFVTPSRAQLLTNACEADPCKALPICGNTTVNIAPSYASTAGTNPIGTCSGVNPAGTTFSYTANWVYLRFTCTTTGSLLFNLTANDGASDLDWALWDITTTGCSSLGVGNLVECNSRGVGATGTQVGALANTLFQNPPTLTAGSTYILGVSRATGGTAVTGFSINFTGSTASLADVTGPSLASVLPFNTCDAVDTIRVKMSEKIRCNQIGAGDFTISTNPVFTAAGTSCPGCTSPSAGINYSNVTDTVIIGFPTALAPGTYTVGLTANGFTDICGNFSNTVPTVTFTVPVRLKDSVRWGFDCAIQKYIDTVYAVGGVSPYQYKAVGTGQSGLYGATTASYNVFTNVSGGQNYTFTARDANLCVADTVINHPAYASMSLITQKVDVPCNNQFTGDTIRVLSTSGGIPPYQYSLSGPGAPVGTTTVPVWSGIVFSGGGASYTITAIDAYGCTKTVTINLINPPVLNLGTTGTNLQCFGACNGTVTGIASGGTPTYTYAINPVNVGLCSATQAANVFSTLGASSYTVTVTDLKGCTKTAVRTITSPSQIVINFNSVVQPTCPNPCSGSFVPSSPAGTGTGSKKFYLFDPTGTFFVDSCITAGCSFGSLCQGTYTVVAKDIANCTNSATITLSLPPIPDIVLDSVKNVLCNGGCSGQIFTTTTGGTSPYAYTFTPINNAPCGNAALFGTGDYQNLPIGSNYKIVVTSPNQCKDSVENISISEPPALTWNNVSGTNLLCFNGCDGTVTALAAGGTPPYSYTISANGPGCTTTQVNPGQFGSLAALTYTVTAIDANNCSITSTISLTQPPQLVLTHTVNQLISCAGACDASVTINPAGGTGAVTGYTITPTAPCVPAQVVLGTFTGLGPNTYTVTAQDANGCTATTSFTINPVPVLTISAVVDSNASCNGFCDGGATAAAAGGTPGYSYGIAGPGSPVINASGIATGLCVGNYTISVTDLNGCGATTVVTITQPPVLSINASGLLMVSCGGLCDGGANMNSSGGTGSVSYTISPNTNGSGCAATQNIVGVFGNLWATTYTVTGTDVNGCTATTTFTITEPSQLFVNALVNTNVSCYGGCNGSATVTFSGGAGGTTYAISPNTPCVPIQASAGVFTNLGANTYTVTGTDVNGCTAITVFSITEPQAPFTLTVNNTSNATCAGACNGSADVSGLGGTPQYSYTILPSAPPCVPTQVNPGVFGNLAAGTYTVNGTDAQGCTTSITFTITEPNILITNVVSTTSPTCLPGCDGTATMNSNGGTPAYSYGVNPAATVVGNVISGLCAGITYTVTSTDLNGCTATTTVTLTTPNGPVVSIIPGSIVNVSCNGLCDGSASATASSGTPPYTYSIAGPGSPTIDPNTGVATNLCAGNYVITVTDDNSCVGTVNVNITEPTLFTISTAVTSDASCNGDCDGTATVSGSGGTPTYTYTNIAGPGSPTLNSVTGIAGSLCAGIYTISAVDGNGCTATSTVQIIEPVLLTLNVNALTNVLCNGQCTGTASASASGGNGGYNYASINGPGSPTIDPVTGAAANLCAGTYTVNVTDSKGCTASATVQITQPPVLTVSVNTTQNVSCNNGCDGSASVSGNGGVAPYSYTINYLNSPCVAQQLTSGNFTNLGADTYTVTVTDDNGCTATVVFTITEPTAPITSVVSSIPPTCTPGCDGQVTMTTIGGTPTYSYGVNPAATVVGNVISGLCAGITYTVTSTDLNGCTATTTVTLTTPNGPVVSIIPGSIVNVSCNGLCDGSASATASSGTPPYTYSIAGPGSPTIDPNTGVATNLCAGNYVITVTDDNSCVGTVNVNITEPTLFTISTAVTSDASCFGDCDGTATVSGSGGTPTYTYTNIAGPGSPTLNSVTGIAGSLCAGIYTISAVDGNGCTATSTVQIIEPVLLTLNVNALANVLCNGQCTGTASASASGGNGGYNYASINGPGSPTIDPVTGAAANLCAGTYTVNVTDSKGCTASATVQITEPPVLSVSVNTTQNVSCNNGCDGSASVSGNGGVAPYSYTINYLNSPCVAQQLTSGNFTNLGADTYTVTVTDDNGCTATVVFTITEPTAPITSVVSSIPPTCTPGCDGQVTMTTIGGTPGYSYGVNPAATVVGNVISGLCAGITYTVTSTDLNGCTATTTVTLTTPNGPVVSIIPGSIVNVSCNGLCDGSASATASSGTPPYTYSIAGPGSPTIDPNTGIATNLCAGNYVITVTDDNSCVGTVNVNITEPSAIVPSAITADASCFNVCDGTATMSSIGGSGGYVYTILPTGPFGPIVAGNNISGLCANTIYTVTSTDLNSCTGTMTIQISQPAQLILNVVSTQDVSCNGGCDGEASLSFAGGTGAVTYSINPVIPCLPVQAVSGTFTNLGANTYTVTGTDANGCIATVSFVINQPTAFSISANVTQNVSCNGGCDGEVVITPNGGTPGYSYSISPITPCLPAQVVSGTFTNLGANTYTVTGTDSKGCTTTVSFTISQPSAPVTSLVSFTLPTCTPGCDGTATMTTIGGTPGYTYTVNPAATVNVNVISGLCAATIYTVTSTDNNGCTANETVLLNPPNSPVISIASSTNPSCAPGCDGTATYTIAGGTAPYSASINNGASITVGPNQISGLCTGILYTITITDANSCSGATTIQLFEPAGPAINVVSTTDASCVPGCDGTATMNPAAGIIYSINPAAGTIAGNVINGLCTGTTYTVTGTDANGCTGTTTVQIGTLPSTPPVVASTTDATCNPGCDGTATMTIIPGMTYSVSPAAGTIVGNVINGLCANTTYTITGTNAAGCTATTTAQVGTTNGTPISLVSTTDASCIPGCDGTATMNPAAGIIYSINPAAGTIVGNVINGLCSGTIYTITGTDVNGCTATVTVQVGTLPSTPPVLASTTDASCTPGCDGTATMTIIPGMTYSVSPAAGTIVGNVINGLCANTTYTITGTNAAGCTATTTVQVGTLPSTHSCPCFNNGCYLFSGL